MKIRTDFVTNSSSSSFVVEISLLLKNGKNVQFSGTGGTDETGRVDYFTGEAEITVSPKELGNAKSVNELIDLLTNGVREVGWQSREPIFGKSNPQKSHVSGMVYDPYDYIRKIKENVASMDDIAEIRITGNEYNYMNYLRTFTYNRDTGAYIGKVSGCDFEKDGCSGGDLKFDVSDCIINGINQAETRRQEQFNLFPALKSIEGTGYEGRNARIEYVKVGDPLILKADYSNRFYSPVAVEVFNSNNETLGYLRGTGLQEIPLETVAEYIDSLEAHVASVTPLSQRRKGSKYALMDVELRLKEHAQTGSEYSENCMGASAKTTPMQFIGFRNHEFVTTGFSEAENNNIRALVTQRGGVFKDAVTDDTYCLIINPEYDHVTNKYLRAVSINEVFSYKNGYVCIITGKQFYELAQRPLPNKTHLDQDDVLVVGDRLVDVPENAESLDISSCQTITTLAYKAFKTCTSLRKVTLSKNINLYGIPARVFDTCPLELLVLTRSIEKIPANRFRNEQIPQVDMPVARIEWYEDVTTKQLAILNYIRKAKQAPVATGLREGYNAYIKRNRKKLYELSEREMIIRYMFAEGILPKEDLPLYFELETPAEESTPDTKNADAQRLAQEEKEAEEQRLKKEKEAEKQRLKEEKAQAAAEKKERRNILNKEKRSLSAAYKRECTKIQEARQVRLKEETDRKREDMLRAVHDKFDASARSLENQLAETNVNLNQTQESLAQLGVLQLLKKKSLRDEITCLQSEVHDLQNQIAALPDQRQTALTETEESLKKQLPKIQKAIEEELPLPKDPVKYRDKLAILTLLKSDQYRYFRVREVIQEAEDILSTDKQTITDILEEMYTKDKILRRIRDEDSRTKELIYGMVWDWEKMVNEEGIPLTWL